MNSKEFFIPKEKYKYFFSYSQKNSWNKILLELRNHAECTQQQVADCLNIERKTYGNYEAGISELKVETIKKIAELYKIPSSIILGEPDLMSNFMEEIKNE